MNGSISASMTSKQSIKKESFCNFDYFAWGLPDFAERWPLLRRRLSRRWSDSFPAAWHGMRALKKQIAAVAVLQSVSEVLSDRSSPASASTTAAAVSRHLPSGQSNHGGRRRRPEASEDQPGRDQQVHQCVQAGAQGDEDEERPEAGPEGHVSRLHHLVHGAVKRRKDDHCLRPRRVPRFQRWFFLGFWLKAAVFWVWSFV